MKAVRLVFRTFMVGMVMLLFLVNLPTFAQNTSTAPTNNIFTGDFLRSHGLGDDYLYITGALPRNHPDRISGKDICEINDEWIFFFNQSGWSNDYNNGKVTFVYTGSPTSSPLLHALLTGKGWKIGGGVGPKDEVPEGPYQFGSYAICVDVDIDKLDSFEVPFLAEQVYQHIKLVRNDPLRRPIINNVSLNSAEKPTLSWQVGPSDGDIAVYRVINETPGEVVASDVSLTATSWSDSELDASCGQSYTYWLSTANEHGNSLWSRPQSIQIAECDDSNPELVPVTDPPVPASNCPGDNRQGVYLYADRNYQGSCWFTLTSISDLASTTVGDNNVSSARIIGDYTVKLYEHANEDGRSKELSSDKDNLDQDSLGGRYSSAEVTENSSSNCPTDGREGVYLYADRDFEGACTFTTSNIDDLGQEAVGNDNVSSGKIIGDYTVKLYEHRNLEGRSKEFSSDKDNLDQDSIGGSYSSVEVTTRRLSSCPSDGREGVYLYGDRDFRGACTYTTSNINDLGQEAVGNDNVSSGRIIGEYKVKLYEHRNLEGRSKEFSSSKDNLDQDSIGGSYSSVKVIVPTATPTSTPTPLPTHTPYPTPTPTPTSPPGTTGPEQFGLNYEYYEGIFDQVPNFDTLVPIKSGIVSDIGLGARTVSDFYAFEFFGCIDIPTDGTHRFSTLSDEGSYLYINDQLVVDNGGLHSAQWRDGTIALVAGKHKFAIEYFERDGGEVIIANYEGPGIENQQIPAAAFSTSGCELSSVPSTPSPIATSTIQPMPTETVQPTVTATATSTVQPTSTETAQPTAIATSAPSATPVQEQSGLNYEYFEGVFEQIPDFDSITPVKSGLVDNLTLAPRQVNDHYAFRYWGCIFVPADGSYRFATLSDEGSYLYMNNQLVVDNGGLHSAQWRDGTIDLTAGKHNILLEYFEHDGGEVILLNYEGPGIVEQPVPASAYSTTGCEARIDSASLRPSQSQTEPIYLPLVTR